MSDFRKNRAGAAIWKYNAKLVGKLIRKVDYRFGWLDTIYGLWAIRHGYNQFKKKMDKHFYFQGSM